MEDIERSCENCKYENEDIAGVHCINCVHNASDNFEPKEVCEYRITDKMVYASCNNKQIASAFCWLNECGDYKHCPYCGKKIKIVDNDK